jgi:hypothetical protein
MGWGGRAGSSRPAQAELVARQRGSVARRHGFRARAAAGAASLCARRTLTAITLSRAAPPQAKTDLDLSNTNDDNNRSMFMDKNRSPAQKGIGTSLRQLAHILNLPAPTTTAPRLYLTASTGTSLRPLAHVLYLPRPPPLRPACTSLHPPVPRCARLHISCTSLRPPPLRPTRLVRGLVPPCAQFVPHCVPRTWCAAYTPAPVPPSTWLPSTALAPSSHSSASPAARAGSTS